MRIAHYIPGSAT